MPFLLFGNVKTICKKGNIVLKCPIKTGMVKIGYVNVPWQSVSRYSSYINNGKHLIFGQLSIGGGSVIDIVKGAVLTTGNNVWIHDNGKIFCYESVTIKDNVLSAWDLLVTDTNFHHYVNDGVIQKWSKPVIVEENCWMGNRVSINKGARIPQNTVVSSNSLVNKDFSNEHNVILGGMPARVLSEKCQSIGGYNIIKYDHLINEYMISHGLVSVNVDDTEFLSEIKIDQFIVK